VSPHIPPSEPEAEGIRGSSGGDKSNDAKGHGSSRKGRLVVVGAVAIVGFVAVAIWQAISGPATQGSTALVGASGISAPPFSLPSLQDPHRNISLASFRGRPVVMNFWASWCVPCRTEMPVLEAAYKSEHGRVDFIGIDSNDTPTDAIAFLAQVHVTYPTVSDPTESVATKYLLYGLPTTVFISPTGKILGRHIGELRASTLRSALQQAFSHA